MPARAGEEPAPLSRPQIEVDLQLVIATDVSGSIDDGEAFLQRKGVADAFRSRDVVQAIRSGGLGRIAVVYADFSSRYYNQVIVDWRQIDSEASSLEFANTLMRIPRTRGRGTSLSDAIELGISLFEASPFRSDKRVIDLSGDGPNNTGRPVREVREEALARGIVINGLPILDPWGNQQVRRLDEYFAGCVIGGPGSFIQTAEGFVDFARAIRRKLVLELSSVEPEDIPLFEPRLIRAAAAPLPQLPRAAPQQVRPDYGGPCDTWGFFP